MIARKTDHKTIAILEPPERRAQGGTVFGASVVVEEATKEMIRNAAPDRVCVYSQSETGANDEIGGKLMSFVRRNHLKHVEFEQLRSIAASSATRQLDHWHDFILGVPPFALRRALSRRGNFPISICHHTVSYQFLYHDVFLKLLLEDVRPYDSLICASTAARDAIRTMMASIAEAVRERTGVDISFNGRLDVVPFGVKTDVFRPRDKADARNQFGFPRDAIIILWVGRLSERDKADLLPLLRVFRRLIERNKRRELLLVLAGSELHQGAQSAELGDYARLLGISDRVRILTTIPPAYRQVIFGTADIFVSPSDNIQETFGLTLIEAMATGVPQVVSNWDGYRDTVKHGETGFLIPTCWVKCDQALERSGVAFESGMLDHLWISQTVVIDLDSFEKHLQLLIDRPALRARMAQASRKRAASEYDWSVIVRRLKELWQDQEEQRQSISNATREWRVRHYTDPKFFEYFKGYAATILSGNEVLTLTHEYERVTYDGEPLPYYFAKSWGFDKKLYLAIMRLMERAAERKRRKTISEVQDALVGRFEGELILRHVMWLLKYGYLRLSVAPAHIGRRSRAAR
jgi:glycosyltransferase involved in cell wall biosynthesis